MTNLTQLARNLRSNSTDAERLLWSRLRAHRLHGLKFKRQQPIDPFIVDFVCFDQNLIVEVDGGQHASQTDDDERRTAFLRERGFQVLRFWNNEVMGNLDGFLPTIALACELG